MVESKHEMEVESRVEQALQVAEGSIVIEQDLHITDRSIARSWYRMLSDIACQILWSV